MSVLSFGGARAFLFFACLALAVAACSNPVEHEDDHGDEVEGFAVVQDGAVVYQWLDNEATCASPPCGITVTRGQTSGVLTVRLLDHDGEPLAADALDDEFSLAFVVQDPLVATTLMRDSNGRWAFQVEGKGLGQTRMEIRLMHGNHADRQTPPVSDARALTIRVVE